MNSNENLQIAILKPNGSICRLSIVNAYEFNKEAVLCKKDPKKMITCFIVEDPSKNDLQEYYYSNDNPKEIWWHNVFMEGGSFAKRLKMTIEGEVFSFQKPIYYWRKLRKKEIATLCNNITFIEVQ